MINAKKRSSYLPVLGLSVSLFATSTLNFFASPVTAQSRNSVAQPTIATVESLVNGDLMCYVTLVDDNGTRYQEVGATFDICATPEAYLNKKVNLVYGEVLVNDCQSAEPCGRTRQETLIIQMTLADFDESRSCSQKNGGSFPPHLK